MSKVRGIRGAISVVSNTEKDILEATTTLLQKLIESNQVESDDIASIFFTVTDDLNAEFPAYAVRNMNMRMVPLLCAREMHVDKGMQSLIRVLMHVNTDKSQNQIKHQYLGKTKHLRPDLNEGESE
ncbi:MAG: chorismate mutase [Candidatus Zixiibacteriota bacterium]